MKWLGRFLRSLLCLKQSCPRCGKWFSVSNRGEWDSIAIYACEKCDYSREEYY